MKTKTSVEIIRQHLKKKKKILVTADSNVAVDNIMMGLIKHEHAIRIGESPKILPQIREHTFENTIKEDIRYRIIKKGIDETTSKLMRSIFPAAYMKWFNIVTEESTTDDNRKQFWSRKY